VTTAKRSKEQMVVEPVALLGRERTQSWAFGSTPDGAFAGLIVYVQEDHSVVPLRDGLAMGRAPPSDFASVGRDVWYSPRASRESKMSVALVISSSPDRQYLGSIKRCRALVSLPLLI